MKITLNNTAAICTAIIASQLLTSCGLFSSKENLPPAQQTTTLINTVDETALTFRANYGTDYEITGNVIAKYPDFHLSLFSSKVIQTEPREKSIYTYELTSKDGFGKTHISCDPRHPEKKHFFLEGLHFYYHSNTDGSINIYMPPQLMAAR